jgi:polysaccharide export outer membrane protein
MKFTVCFGLILGLSCMPSRAQFGGNAPVSPSHQTEGASLLESLLHARRTDLQFAPDDVISVQVYGVKDYVVQQQIAQDGSVLFPLIGKVQVAGLTVEQLENSLAKLLASSGMVRDPQVTVTAISRPSAIVTVSGDVAKPGTFPAYGNRTLTDYLSDAGWLNNTVPTGSPISSPASSTVTLLRPSLAQPVAIPLGPNPAHSPYGNIPLFPGDQIRVGTVGVVYAVGAFKTQGAYPLKNTSATTVLQLVALAGGIGYEADRKDAHVIRTEGDRRYILDLNVAGILKGKAADVALRSDDILFVPSNAMRAAIKGGGSGLVVSLAAAYLYSHP